jgi:hypothetical protein
VGVTHPFLIADDRAGEVTVHRPQEGLVLRLTHGPRSVFALDPMSTYTSSARLLLFENEADDQPLSEHPLALVDGKLTFGGYKPGTYMLWLNVPASAPFVRRGVALGPDTTDLGTLRLERGASVRVSVLTRSGTAAPGLRVVAERLDEPVYSRWMTSNAGQLDVTIPGLGPGRFRVSIDGSADKRRRLERIVDVDGATDIPIVLDTRDW